MEDDYEKAPVCAPPSHKSKQIYTRTYHDFLAWCSERNDGNYSENTFLAYFSEISKKFKASTLWSYYSMLKSTFMMNQNIDISKYNKLVAFIKRSSENYKPTKSKTFTIEDINKFITEAPDDSFLMIKVVAILGIAGGCRRHELCDIEVDDIQDTGSALIVNIKESENKVLRTFVVTDNNNQIPSLLETFRKYTSLRPKSVNHKRLFIRYANGKCTNQPIGVNHFGKIPFKIAQFLSLPDPNSYTGHCFRRSSHSLQANSGVNISAIKRHEGWNSTAVAEEFVETSIETDTKEPSITESSNEIFLSIPPDINIKAEPSCSYNVTHNITSEKKDQGLNISLGNLSNCTNSTININIYINQ